MLVAVIDARHHKRHVVESYQDDGKPVDNSTLDFSAPVSLGVTSKLPQDNLNAITRIF